MPAGDDRQARRRLLAGVRDPVRQNILDLVDRIERNRQDEAAGHDLVTLAKLRPEVFTDDVLAVLLDEAAICRREPLFEALYEVSLQQERPDAQDLLRLARPALQEYWGIPTAIKVYAAHASPVMFDDQELMSLLIAAAGPIQISIGMTRIPEHPEPLIRLYDLAPDRLLAHLTTELTHVEPRRRIHAAIAARELMYARPGCGAPLAHPLVHAATMPTEGPRPHGWKAIRHIIGKLVALAPERAEAAVDAVWADLGDRAKKTLLDGLDSACRDRMNEFTLGPAASVIARRTLMVIRQGSSPELLRRAADTLSLVCRCFANEIDLPLADMLRALADMTAPSSPEPCASPEDALAGLERLAALPYRGIALDDLAAAIVSLARCRPDEFWPACAGAWRESTAGSPLRTHLSHMVASLCKQHELVPDALPMLEEVLAGDEQDAKAAILWNVAKYRWPGTQALPDVVSEAIVACLLGNVTATVEPAVEAVRQVALTSERRMEVVARLLTLAHGLAPDRSFHRMVDKAIESSLLLAEGTPMAENAKGIVLEAIMRMYPLDASECMRWRPELQDHPGWLAAAVHCMLPHGDRHFWGLSRENRQRLARELARRSPAEIAPYLDVLIGSATAWPGENLYWAWYLADVLAYLGFFDAAAAIAHEVLIGVPAGPGHVLVRLAAEQAWACYAFEAAVARGDEHASKEATSRWRTAASLEESEREKDPDARGLVRPPFMAD